MSRVEENREAQRVAEQRRLEDQQRAKQREASFEFQKVVAQQQESARQGQARQGAARETDAKAKGEAQAGAAVKSKAATALLARQGIQSRAFTQGLRQRGESSVEKARVEAQGRREEINDERVKTGERRAQTERFEQRLEHDRLAAVSGEGRRGQGQMGGEAGEGGGMDMGGHAQPAVVAGGAAAQESRGPAARAPALPPEIIQRLVDRVYAGVTPEGLSQFTLELKDGVLGGARLDIVGGDGKISCTFHTGDKDVGRLLQASEGALARAFSQKGLTLERLEVIHR